jgi:hypothetical protein
VQVGRTEVMSICNPIFLLYFYPAVGFQNPTCTKP